MVEVMKKVFFSQALGRTYQYDANVVDLASFVKDAGPSGGNRELGVPHMIALRCRLPDDVDWKLVRHSWSEAKTVLVSIDDAAGGGVNTRNSST